jgi:D-psicose/D-tagatose/L-ribulose 3-epimerase
MKIGVNTLLWTAHFDREHIELLPRVKEHGFDAIEIARFNWDAFPAADVRREAGRLSLDVIGCTAMPGLSLIHEEAGERARAVEYVKQAVRATAEMGGRLLVGPVFSPVGWLPGRRRTVDEWKRQVESLREIGLTLDELGVELAVEPLNRFETFFLNTNADASRLCDEVGHKRIGILHDTFHANIEEKNQAGAIAAAGEHLKHVHTCENDRGIPGSGHVEWDAVFPALRKAGYGGYLVIESFGFAIKEIAAAACIWRDLAASPDAIAWEGIKFLREKAAPRS